MEFPFMTLRLLRLTAITSLLIAPALIRAQETTASEDERIEQLVRSEASEWYTPKNTVTVGFHVLTSGVNVRFGNLGSVGFNPSLVESTPGVLAARTYDNGHVDVDVLRSTEVDANGNQTSTPGGRYQTHTTTTNVITDADGNAIGQETVTAVSGDYLSYTPGLTRSWGYSTPEQAALMPGYIGMSNYAASSEGGSFSKKQGPSAGVELQISHAFRKLGKRIEIGVVAGLALNGINNKTSGDVHSTLLTQTDYYSLNGLPAPDTSLDDPYLAPDIPPDGITEETTPISAEPDPSLSATTQTPGGAVVHGVWQIKGAYFMLRLGPSLRAQVSERFGFSASLGVAGAYVGTHYTASESIEIPIVGTTRLDSVYTDSDATKFLGGYYADFNLDWATNDTLAVFGGVSAQKFGNYTQTLGSRDALIDLGSSVGLRGGINIKF